ncbi:MAG: DUF4233 domain-containing protein [Candidatus Nanopelagicales bacterium]
MKVLCSSVLAFEAIVVLLAIPVALNFGWGSDRTALVVGGGFTLALLLLLAIGTLRRPWGLTAGWVLQAAVIACGFVVPAMFVLGVVFAVLWWVAIHYGSRGDAIKAARSASS